MKNTTKIFANLGVIAMVAVLFAGCSLLPSKVDTTMENKVTVEDEGYTQLSPDDSLETIEEEIDATVIGDEDLSELEADMELELDTTMEK